MELRDRLQAVNCIFMNREGENRKQQKQI